jgi:nucleotide-binding universal stress UspA family protein
MTILVAVSDTPEGHAALQQAVAEAQLLNTDLVAMNLGLRPLDVTRYAESVTVTVVDRHGRGDRDPADAVLDEIAERRIERLVIGIKRRSPVGKAILGSVSQRLLLNCPVPVLAVNVV